MKRIYLVFLIIWSITVFHQLKAQTLNWAALEPQQRHLISLHTGFDHGIEFGLGYGYQVKSKWPLTLHIDFSTPGGDNFFDDFKTKIGGQLNLVQEGNFRGTIKAFGIFRRYENDMSRMLNFGSEFSATAGYYRKGWFAGAEFGFDKAVITHIKHSRLMHDYNPSVQNGWYIPTGGNFFYGLQGGISLTGSDLYIRAGRTVGQDWRENTLIPFYAQFGWNMKFQ